MPPQPEERARRSLAGSASANPDRPGQSPNALGAKQCPNCAALTPIDATVCQECGEPLHAKPQIIRCRQCHKRASSNLVICPHCGRELHPAPSSFLTLGAPIVIVLLLAAVLATQWRGGPGQWAAGLATALDSAGQPQPEMAGPVMTPLAADNATEDALPPDALALSGEQAPAGASSQGAGDAAGNGNGGGDESDGDESGEADSEDAALAVGAAQPIDAAAAEPPAEMPTEAPPTPSDTPTSLPTATATAEPTATPSPVPSATPAPTATDEPTATATATRPPTSSPTVPPTATPRPTSTATPQPARPTATATRRPTRSITVMLPTSSASQSAAAVDGETAQAAAPAMPTATPTPIATTPVATTPAPLPTATATQPPATATPPPAPALTYTVRPGDTLVGIAARHNVSTEALMAANNITPGDVYALQVGKSLIIPGPAGAAAANAAPTATPGSYIYVVRAGDTMLRIANLHDVPMDEILAANGMSRAAAARLSIGQEIIIPIPGQAPAATPTATALPAATPSAAEPAPNSGGAAAAPASVEVRLDAPVLRSPENGSAISCSQSYALTWSEVPFILQTDSYLLHLGYVSGQSDSGETVTWILNQPLPYNRTSWDMDQSLCGAAPQEMGRQWRWFVEVADQNVVPVSHTSAVWGFSWN